MHLSGPPGSRNCRVYTHSVGLMRQCCLYMGGGQLKMTRKFAGLIVSILGRRLQALFAKLQVLTLQLSRNHKFYREASIQAMQHFRGLKLILKGGGAQSRQSLYDPAPNLLYRKISVPPPVYTHRSFWDFPYIGGPFLYPHKI